MDMLPNTKHIEKWSGQWRGVKWEINKLIDWYKRDSGPSLTRDGHGWTFYLIVNEEQFTPEEWAGLWLPEEDFRNHDDTKSYGAKYSYYNSGIISAVELHGDCTYYEKYGGFPFQKHAVKFGCDYAHYGDDEYAYDLRWLWHDVKRAIESLWGRCPKLLVWCHHCGEYLPQDTGEWTHDDTCFICNACDTKRQEEKAKRDAGEAND